MDKKPLLKAIYGSDKTPLKLGETEIPCYVLEDGTRVFSGRAIQKALGSTATSGTWLTKFVNDSPITPFLKTGVLEQLNSPIKFQRPNSGGSQSATYGYEVTILIDICDSILEAKKTGKNVPNNIVENAELIIRSVAKVGIVALVDEVTGYYKDKNRAKDELQKFLKQFMRDDAAKLVKRFEDTFFEMIYKMRGWTWNYAHRHPGVVGLWINDIVYERIAPLVLAELRKKNPKTEKGTRKNKHHQFLTDEVGVPKLLNHLAAVEALGRASNYNWNTFMSLLDTAFPKQYQQMTLLFNEESNEDSKTLSDFDMKLKKGLDFNPKEDKTKDDDESDEDESVLV